ncbi:sterol desaturase family protein [Asaia prunellae]|uniref:hypothetical protein n=1 Tax=Asaia prunellae TaxID=610245 RepID=UPI000684973D|nr:hypothetical protein [Asaia prunellae]
MTVRLFKNAYLERMTYMPIYLFLPVWLAAIVVVFIYSLPQPFFHGLFLYVSGYLTWTLTEYLGHRFFFHFNFSSESGRKLIYVIHGNHHELPKDKLRNMMPLSITIPLAILIWLLPMPQAVVRERRFSVDF